MFEPRLERMNKNVFGLEAVNHKLAVKLASCIMAGVFKTRPKIARRSGITSTHYVLCEIYFFCPT